MSFKAHSCIRFTHAATIVNHLDQCFACIFYNKLDMSRAGVERVLHQFLHRRSRPLNHFTGGNLVGNGIRKLMNDVRHFKIFDFLTLDL